MGQTCGCGCRHGASPSLAAGGAQGAPARPDARGHGGGGRGSVALRPSGPAALRHRRLLRRVPDPRAGRGLGRHPGRDAAAALEPAVAPPTT